VGSEDYRCQHGQGRSDFDRWHAFARKGYRSALRSGDEQVIGIMPVVVGCTKETTRAQTRMSALIAYPEVSFAG
ncbi:MAG TPA: hypothetical protein VJ800_09675, partial [Pseudolabrys sp.]|nr:hypothetical protein [Pseudolabrys sp.]